MSTIENMSKVDFGSYKRIVQAFWDPEPKNDDVAAPSIWCLGREYAPKEVRNGVKDELSDHHADTFVTNGMTGSQATKIKKHDAVNDSSTNGDSAQRHNQETDLGWPSDFLDDCEARVWFTYRSSFPPIKKSSEASMTLSVRLRSLGDQGGFTSDTGWGCMIRSGQSLLANALTTLRLGRGWPHTCR